MSPRTRGSRSVAMSLLLVAAVAAIYGQTSRHDFIAFDDGTYIVKNAAVTGGLSWKGVLWAFGAHAGNWHPLTWLSHMLDVSVFGLWAGGHHLVSAGIHAVNAVALLALLRAMTGTFWPSAAVAALFAVHPLRVESVAWAAERKDVLSALFWMLTLGAYLFHLRRPDPRRYLAAFLLFALGLAAKPMVVTLPFVLLLLDWWPLGRTVRAGEGRSPWAFRGLRRVWLPLVAEKAPFLALSLLSGLVTLWAQKPGVLPMVTPTLGLRLANAATTSLRYLETFVWPVDLAILYPFPRAGIPSGVTVAVAAALFALGAIAIHLGRRLPYLAVGWFWYLGTLVPVIGIVQVGGQARGDRYTYLTTIGLAVALVWLIKDVWPRGGWARGGLAAGSVLTLAALLAASAAYVRVWRDSLALFEHTVRVTEENAVAMNNLGTALLRAGRPGEAAVVLRRAAEIDPDACDAHYNLGAAFALAARPAAALEPFSRALRCYEREGRGPGHLADTHYNLGLAYRRLDRSSLAAWHLRTLLQIAPEYPGGRVALEEVLAREGSAPPGP